MMLIIVILIMNHHHPIIMITRSGDLMHNLSCPYPRLAMLPAQSQVRWNDDDKDDDD